MPKLKYSLGCSISLVYLAMLGCTSNAGTDGIDVNLGQSAQVNPFMGTAGHGHVYPGATVPFGAVQLSPDNGTEGWDWCSGYNYQDTTIVGFSHTHLSGTGIGDLCDLLMMPCHGDIDLGEAVIKISTISKCYLRNLNVTHVL